ncbi:MAG: hypothetical protein M3442_02215 [Chloroflexota bacterium]|nr:hypothetical protein [Chloroflexota bacterium]
MLRDLEGEAQSSPDPWRRPLAGLFDLFESGDERAYAAVLQALARERVDVDSANVEKVATSRRSMADVKEAESEIEADVLADARRRLHTFRTALEDAYTRSRGSSQLEVAYDSADADQDGLADVLIQYLVRTGYGDVSTDEPAPGQYVYNVRVDWDRLCQLAAEQGHPLPFPGAG